MSTRRKRRTFTDEFKKQLVDLHKAGKPRKDIIEEYELTLHHSINGSSGSIKQAHSKKMIISHLNKKN